MSAAQRATGWKGKNLFATLTMAHGSGQIVGPLLADALYAHSHDFAPCLVMAAGALLLAVVVSLLF